MTQDTTTTNGAADLPEALRRSTAADGKTELFNLPGYPLMVRAVDFNRIHTESEMRRTALLDEMQKAALAEGQATAAQAVVQDDLITVRKPTTSAELLWLLKLAHLVISDVDKTLEEAFAPAQPAVEASRFGSPELQAMIIARCVEKDQAESVPAVEREQERIAFKDAHRHLDLDEVPDAWGRPMFKHSHVEASWLGWIARASHGQASSQADEYPALVCDYCGALTPDPWHSSGMLHGKMSKHIHSCDACAARGAAQAQAAKQQEQLI